MRLADLVTRGVNAQNITYTLHDKNDLFLAGYKVLLGSGQSNLITCAKYTYNGKTKLLYHSASYASLASLKARLHENNLMHILVNILSAVIAVKSNGFLDPRNIDVSPEALCIDRATLAAHLIYVPINNRASEGEAEFSHNELRETLVDVIKNTPALDTETLHHVTSQLSDSNKDLPLLLSSFRALVTQPNEGIAPTGELSPPAHAPASVPGGAPTGASTGGQIQDPRATPTAAPAGTQTQDPGAAPTTMLTDILTPSSITAPILQLVSSDAGSTLCLTINKAEYLIGKAAGAVDGVISDNRAVSRRHCKVTRRGSSFSVVDLGSSNGTFLNGQRLTKDIPATLEHGSVLMIANSVFNVALQEG